MNKKKEIRVYVIDILGLDWDEIKNFMSNKNIDDITNDEFMDYAEQQGNVWSIGAFKEQWNKGSLSINVQNSFIRFI